MNNKQAGFTLIELVASLLVITAIVQTFIFISDNVNSSSELRDSLVASNLVQEGIEVVRNIRDQDWFFGRNFGTSLPTGSWRVQWDSNALLDLSGNPLLKKNSNGIFSYDSAGTDTVFRRQIDVTVVSASELMVISTVTWDVKSNLKTISAEAHLFDWHKQ